MTTQPSLYEQGTITPAKRLIGQRSQPRFHVEARVALAHDDSPKPIMVQNKDLSWGGASFLVARQILELDDSLVLRFPWCQGGSFPAHAEVVWNQQVDDEQCLVGVSFSKLRIRDEEKLQRLLSMLMKKNQANRQDIAMAESLELHFLDRRELLAALEQIRFGYIETTAFRSFELNERIRLVLTGFADLPTLKLRARILWQKRFGTAPNSPAPGLFQIALALEHPSDDLGRATDLLTDRLSEIRDPKLSLVPDRRKSGESVTSEGKTL